MHNQKGASKISVLIIFFAVVFVVAVIGSFHFEKYQQLNYELSALVFRYDQSVNTTAEFKVKIKNLLNLKKFIRDPSDFIGKNWAGETNGLVQFRGNPTHTFYGTGPIGENLKVAWRFPESEMCGKSVVGRETKLWCGTGWTGQPVVWERKDSKTEVIFGAYDKAVHFLNAKNGERLREDFKVGDIIKGSVSLDPDGFPLLYFGSRDNKFRILSLNEGEEAKELWALDAYDVTPTIWNDDWDGNATVVDDVLYVGGENGWMFAIKLNREMDRKGKVSVDPKILMQFPLWTDGLLKDIGDEMVSIENSPAFYGGRVYVANGGGRVVGFDVADIQNRIAPIVFDYWLGDDIDSSIVIDGEGMLYVSAELDRDLGKNIGIGQITKLNPYLDNPVVWTVSVDNNFGSTKERGIWATPALYKDFLYVQSTKGKFIAIDTVDGGITWSATLPEHSWSSPLVVDDQLIVSRCDGEISFYDLSDPSKPNFLKNVKISDGCIESTPAVWNGKIYVGSRDGYFYAISGDKER